MQDIPRNELLDKLAAGWKVRLKGWPSSDFQNRLEGGRIRLEHLLGDNWEGEPPEPVCNGKDLSIVRAFDLLRDGQAFVRRSAWKPHLNNPMMRILNYPNDSAVLTTEDILANDWEVWG